MSGLDWSEDTKRIREWLSGGCVAAEPLARDLLAWADHILASGAEMSFGGRLLPITSAGMREVVDIAAARGRTLRDLSERLENAASTIDKMAVADGDAPKAYRLRLGGKAEGVRLALSYLHRG